MAVALAGVAVAGMVPVIVAVLAAVAMISVGLVVRAGVVVHDV